MVEDEDLAATEEDIPVDPPVESSGDSAPPDGDVTAASSDDAVEETPEDEADRLDADVKAAKRAERDATRRASKGAQKRIKQLVKEKSELQRHIADVNQAQHAQQAELKEPQRDDFDDYEKYVAAIGRHAAQSQIAEADDLRQRQYAAARAQQGAAARDEVREAALTKGIAKYDDFEELTTSDDLQISTPMADALLSSDNTEEIWYHLGQNPDKAAQINAMPPTQQILAIGRLASELKSPPKPSGAPKPVTRVGSQGGANSTNLNDNLSIKEWQKRRNKQLYG